MLQRLLVALAALSGAALAERLSHGVAAEPPTLSSPVPTSDAAGPVALSEAVSSLEQALRNFLVGAQRSSSERERAVQRALLYAQIVLGTCQGGSKRHQGSVKSLVEACATIIVGSYGAEVRQHALVMLRWIAVGGCVDPSDLQRIVTVCDQGAVRPDISQHYALYVLDAIAESEAADAATLRAIIGAARRMTVLAPSPLDPTNTTGLLSDVVRVVGKVAPRIGGEALAGDGIVDVAWSVFRATADDAPYDALRIAVLKLLSDALPPAQGGGLFVHVLSVMEAYAAEASGGRSLVSSHAAELLSQVAEGIDDIYLERVVAVCERLAMWVQQPSVEKTLRVVTQRLLGDDYRGRADGRVKLLARSFAAQERTNSSIHCASAFNLLRGLEHPDTASHVALRRVVAHGVLPPVDLAIYVDDFVPSLPEESDRSQIVEICAKSAREDGFKARSVLHAASLLPRRVGLRAARAFAALALEKGGEHFEGKVGPVDFMIVGFWLKESMSTMSSAEGAAYLRRLDVDLSERIASELLGAAARLFDRWPNGYYTLALKTLCGLTGSVHTVCEEPDVRSGLVRTAVR